ncbi:MAG: aminotransferase, partial [Hydrogenophaga sp.]
MNREHGGPDADGVPRWDFSTSTNACGPCPAALQAVQQADPVHYPDPRYTDLRHALAAFHQVAPERIVPGASASELIARITALAHRGGARAGAVGVPRAGRRVGRGAGGPARLAPGRHAGDCGRAGAVVAL